MSAHDKAPPAFAVELGRRLRAVRLERYLSCAAVQEKSKKSESRFAGVLVAAWERGDRRISVEQLVALCRFYEVPVTEVLLDGGLLPDGMPDTEHWLVPEGAAL